ncbi:transmembrane protein, putative [Medicago truncatula]|uniref:Transmembrane protein, putative n=1 Tax=Medicago truncatula TaxID=3880 RepID=A0A072UDT2_MEDTR|nr:transmembrane protein, putative [Medicago truncatula]
MESTKRKLEVSEEKKLFNQFLPKTNFKISQALQSISQAVQVWILFSSDLRILSFKLFKVFWCCLGALAVDTHVRRVSALVGSFMLLLVLFFGISLGWLSCSSSVVALSVVLL